MRLVTWNCNGALRKKFVALDSLDADILMIQECENPAHCSAAFKSWAGDYLWIGDSPHKGVGVFAKRGHVVRALEWERSFQMPGLTSRSAALGWSSRDLKLFLPFEIDQQIVALALWTKGSGDQAFGYIGQFWKYLQLHRGELARDPALIAGDFNSNTIWDQPDRWWNHSDVVQELADIGLESLYHHHSGEAQGAETAPTFFLQRNPAKPFHIDYLFASAALRRQFALRIGAQQDWLSLSDHLPVIVDLA